MTFLPTIPGQECDTTWETEVYEGGLLKMWLKVQIQTLTIQ